MNKIVIVYDFDELYLLEGENISIDELLKEYNNFDYFESILDFDHFLEIHYGNI